MEDRSLILVVHGEAGTGKSRLGHTAPAPRLVLDAENGSRFVPVSKVAWDPNREPPPAPGEWESCVVKVRDFATVKRAYEWLERGDHPFRSVVLDSITEIQKRCRDAIGGESALTERQWGDLLVQMERLVRDFRDLTMNPKLPIEALVVLALSDEKKGKVRPLIQGSLGMSLPGFVDTIGYLAAFPEDDVIVRRLLVSPHTQFEAKDRTGRLPTTIDDPNVSKMIETIYGPETVQEGSAA